MKILVTGGAGFLGSNLCRRLLAEREEVVCLDNFYTGRKKNIEELCDNPNFRLVEHDICNKLPTEEKFDQIYNLACPASPPAYQKNPIFTFNTSVLGVTNLLEKARQDGSVLLQASTSEVYGDPKEHPQKESYWGNVNPIGIRACYDEGKRAAECLMMDHHRMFGTKIRIVRIFNTYGPFMDPKDGRVVSNFIVQALLNQDITIYGDGRQTRSFQYVDDLVEAMIRMMNNKEDFIGPVNTGNMDEFTMNELHDLVMKMIPESTSNKVYLEIPSDDPKVRKPDNSLAFAKLGWKPEVKLSDGLKKTIEYFRGEVLMK